MVPADSHRISLVPRYSGYCSSNKISVYRAITYIAQLSRWFYLICLSKCSPTTPKLHATLVWALPCSLATTWGIICYFLFLLLLRCFSSEGWLLLLGDTSSTYQVVPFGNLRFDGCMHLPEAYRSLPRPSSPLSAKASTIRPYSL